MPFVVAATSTERDGVDCRRSLRPPPAGSCSGEATEGKEPDVLLPKEVGGDVPLARASPRPTQPLHCFISPRTTQHV